MRDVANRVSPWFLVLLGVTAAGGALCVIGTPEAVAAGRSTLLTVGVVLLVLGGWATSLVLHEFGHAIIAYRGGDHTVRAKGYLTLDIRRYTDVGLSFVLPIVILLIGGIPLPGGAVWIQHGLIRSRGMRSLVSFAGPAVNLVLGGLLTLAVAAVPMPVGLAAGLSCLALFQVLAFVLNILPVPGLDGFGILEPYLSPGPARLAATIRPWAPIALFVVIIAVPGASGVFFQVGLAIFETVGGASALAGLGYTELMFWR